MAGLRQQRGEATRNEIISVARRLFSDFGYHNTGIADIQAATGLTKGAFYHHFRAKQELGLAVLELAQADYAEQVIAPAMTADTAGQRLSSLLDHIVELNEHPEWRNCQLLATLCAELTPVDGELMEAVRGVQAQLADTFRSLMAEAQEQGDLATGSADVWAQLMLSTLTGLLLVRKVNPAKVDLRDVVGRLKSRLLPKASVPVRNEQKAKATRPDKRETDESSELL